MTTPDKLPLREKFCYGFGDLASVLYWQTFMVYLTFFYTDVFGLTALAAAAMIGLSRSIDAFFDPVMGMIADRTSTRWGKYRPYLLWLCVPFAFAGVLTFTTPGQAVTARLDGWFGRPMQGALGSLSTGFHWLGGHGFGWLGLNAVGDMAHTLSGEVSGALIWAILTYNLLMVLYTAINIPYTAMLGVISPNSNERTTLSSIKFIFAFSAGIIISAALLLMAKGLGGGDVRRGWQLAFVIIGAAAVVFFLITFFNTRERVTPPKSQKTSVARDLRDLITNVPWLVLLATTITFILFVAVRSSVTAHYFKYYVGSHELTIPFMGGPRTYTFEWLVSAFNTSGQIFSLIGVVLVPFFARRVGKKLAFIFLFVVSVASTASFYFLKPDQLGLIYGINLVGSLTGAPLSALIWAMYADAADYSEWKHGRRATGLVFSASIFSQKEGWAIGAAVSLGLMASVGFKANVDQTRDTLHGLRMLMSLIPAAVGVVSILIVAFYPLNEGRMSQIESELKARRAAAEPAAEPAA